MEAERRVERIGKRAVDAAKPAAQLYRLWDSELKGFGLRVTPAGVRTYFVKYRPGGGRAAPIREFTIGRHGELTPDQARSEAERILGTVRLGGDPQAARSQARRELTVAELCDLYLVEGVTTKKPLTVQTDRLRIAAHIKPLLGRRQLSSVTSSDVERFMRDVAAGKTAVAQRPTAAQAKAGQAHGERRRRTDAAARGGKGTATRTVGLLGGIFSFAVRRGLRAENPVRGVTRYRDRQSQRYLSGEELARLAQALEAAAAGGVGDRALNVIRLLVLTGARKSEIETLRWDAVDFARSQLRLADSKTGARVVTIGAAALLVLHGIERGGSPFVFPGDGAKPRALSVDRPFVGTAKVWTRHIRPAAGLTDVRLHDLRHTYASVAAGGGQSLHVIGAILGHRDVKTTAQYAHLADDPLRAAADRTAEAAAAAMAGRSAEVVPYPRSARQG